MKIYLGADHNGFRLKESIKRFLQKKNYQVVDEGNGVLDPADDYPIFAFKVGEGVVRDKSMGILACGSAQGMCIAANKVKGVRAATVGTVEETKLVREHNDVNIICIPGWNEPSDVERIVETFLETKFSSADRHMRRVKEIEKFERK